MKASMMQSFVLIQRSDYLTVQEGQTINLLMNWCGQWNFLGIPQKGKQCSRKE